MSTSTQWLTVTGRSEAPAPEQGGTRPTTPVPVGLPWPRCETLCLWRPWQQGRSMCQAPSSRQLAIHPRFLKMSVGIALYPMGYLQNWTETLSRTLTALCTQPHWAAHPPGRSHVTVSDLSLNKPHLPGTQSFCPRQALQPPSPGNNCGPGPNALLSVLACLLQHVLQVIPKKQERGGRRDHNEQFPPTETIYSRRW